MKAQGFSARIVGTRGGWLAFPLFICVVAAVERTRADRPMPGPATAPPGAATQRSVPAAGRSSEGAEAPATAISRLAVAPTRAALFTEEREAAALVFVRKHRPELEAMLDRLRSVNPNEYQHVICDLFRTSEAFAAMRVEDPQCGALALEGWRIEAKTQLLAAELVGHPEQRSRLESELRKTVEQLANLRTDQAAYEVRRLEMKLQRANNRRQQVESGREAFVAQRLAALLQAVHRIESARPSAPQASH